jgi:hypothetical protein
MSSAVVPPKKRSGHRENDSGIERKPFAFPSESLFAISPESRSPSSRNRFRVHPGILFAFARNPHGLRGMTIPQILHSGRQQRRSSSPTVRDLVEHVPLLGPIGLADN